MTISVEAHSGGVAPPLLSFAALALGPGTLLLREIASGAELPDLLIELALDLLPRLLHNLINSAGMHGATGALAEELPPQQLLDFLRAVVDAESARSGSLTRPRALRGSRLDGSACRPPLGLLNLLPALGPFVQAQLSTWVACFV